MLQVSDKNATFKVIQVAYKLEYFAGREDIVSFIIQIQPKTITGQKLVLHPPPPRPQNITYMKYETK